VSVCAIASLFQKKSDGKCPEGGGFDFANIYVAGLYDRGRASNMGNLGDLLSVGPAAHSNGIVGELRKMPAMSGPPRSNILLDSTALSSITVASLTTKLGGIVAAFGPALFQIASISIEFRSALAWSMLRELRGAEIALYRRASQTEFIGNSALEKTMLMNSYDGVILRLTLLSMVSALLLVLVQLAGSMWVALPMSDGGVSAGDAVAACGASGG